MNLSQLIDTHRSGRSYQDLARDCGGKPTAGRLQQMVTQPMKNFPDPPTVEALAQGLRVSQTAVVLASAESLGLEVGTAMPRLLQLLPAAAEDLTEEQAAAIAQLVRTIVRPTVTAVPDIDDQPSDGPEPRVSEVLRAREQHLRAVAQGGDRDDAEKVDEIAERARRDQLGDQD